jgi:HEAT repeat protein
MRTTAMKTPCADTQPSTEDLIAMLGHAEEGVRVYAAVRLGSPGRAGRDAVSALVGLLRSEAMIDRRVAALALGKVGPAAREALPALLQAMDESDDAGLRAFAAEAIARIAPDASRRRAA